ncbi:MAG: hypothetical protein AB1772_10595 [Candidatus Zixiibacteriota bacterium]
MNRLLTYLGIAAIGLTLAASNARSGVDIGLSADDGGIRSFYLAIGDHYRVPEREVVVVRERSIPDDQLPVVFFLARYAKVEPGVIVKLRLSGQSWMDIALHYHLSPEIFYVQFDHDPGPPFGKAWGHYKKRDRGEWGKIRLADADIVNVVNLKFVSEHYGCTPAEVVKMRAKGDNFVSIHKQVKANKGQGKKSSSAVADSDNAKGKGKKK